jgi:predicted dehydrogenase
MHRRTFLIQAGASTALSMTLPTILTGLHYHKQDKVKIGFIGVGARGFETLKLALYREDVLVTAICDIDEKAATKAQETVVKAGQPSPKLFTNDDNAYKQMLASKDLEAVFICTPWEWHTPMAVASMEVGIAVACEVAGAMSIDECWQLVRTYERTQTPFMIMENVCYRRDVMAVLNMVRQDMFGELLHLEGGYQHDLREVKFNDGVNYYGGGVEFGEKGISEAKWRTTHSLYRNGDLYPTHGIGPIANMIHNNRGNRFEYLTSMASNAKGLHDYIIHHPKGGNDHPNAKVNFRLGDIVTTQIKTSNGETILLTHDTNLPRPYSLGFRVQGTKGIWMDINKSIYLEGKSPAHKWELAETYLKMYDHPLWSKYADTAANAGHGGMDWFVMNAFIEAYKGREAMPLDVYDHASWAAITCLSEQSIAQGGEPQAFPDFTDGKWMNRKPIFALGEGY